MSSLSLSWQKLCFFVLIGEIETPVYILVRVKKDVLEPLYFVIKRSNTVYVQVKRYWNLYSLLSKGSDTASVRD